MCRLRIEIPKEFVLRWEEMSMLAGDGGCLMYFEQRIARKRVSANFRKRRQDCTSKSDCIAPFFLKELLCKLCSVTNAICVWRFFGRHSRLPARCDTRALAHATLAIHHTFLSDL